MGCVPKLKHVDKPQSMYRVMLDIGTVSQSSSIRYRYRDQVRYDTDVKIKFDTIPISESSSIRYRYRNQVRYDTDKPKQQSMYTISIFDASKLSFSIFTNKGMPGDGGKTPPIRHVETSIARYIGTFDTISNTNHIISYDHVI